MRRFPLASLALACSLVACSEKRDDASQAEPQAGAAQTPEEEKHQASAEHGPHEGSEADAAKGDAHQVGHHRFDDPVKWAKVFDDPERKVWQKPDRVVEWTQLKTDETIADIGAGTGYFTVLFAKELTEGKVFANDIEPSMVSYIEERAKKADLSNVVGVLGSAEGPGLSEAVDVAFLCDVYHHIEDPSAYFTKLLEQLKPDGRIIIVEFKPNAPEGSPGPPKAIRLAPVRIDHELQKIGLKMTRMETAILDYQYMLEFKRTSSEGEAKKPKSK
jgi:ubiquinone/menaquinone biosynthesis C-methylase UbiE